MNLRVIAHRGASGYAPENTLAAFRMALELNAQAVELDVHETRDGELVVIHDPDLRRIAGSKQKVKDLSYSELSSKDAGSWFSPEFKDEKVPKLEAVLDLVDGKVEVHVELKDGSGPGVESRLLNLLQKRSPKCREFVVSSFDHKALARFRALDPRLRLGYLVGLTPYGGALRQASELGCESIHISLRQVSTRWTQGAHGAHKKLLVYTVNTPEEADGVESAGADGIFSNYPDLLVPISTRLGGSK